MALETLKGITEIGEFKVVVMDELREKFPEKFNESGSMDYKWFEKDIRPNHFIYVRHDVNSISFTLQKGPVKENGINGCQIDTMIEAAIIMLTKLNEQFSCGENAHAIVNLKSALTWLDKRRTDRLLSGVEGTSQT